MSLSPKILELLKNVPLFSGLSNEVLIQHLDQANRINITAGKTLLAPGDANENIYVVLSGRLRVSPDKSSKDPIAMFGEGDSAGEMSILSGSKALDYLSAETDCELLCIDLTTLWTMVTDSHKAALNMLNILSTPAPINKSSNHHNDEHQHGYSGFKHVDELTGLYNSEWMFQIFERQVRRLSITNEYAILMMVSIDQFDLYKQRYGILGGDQAFRAIAQSVLTCLRPDDHSGRYYGNVIAVFMAHTTLEEGRTAGQRLLRQSSQTEVVTPSGDALPQVTISIGITEIREATPLQQLFDKTAEALSRAVAAGGNCLRD